VRLVFLGPPGVGKGTQSSIIANGNSIPHVATGDILRKSISDKTGIGLEAKAYIDSGRLVPDEVIIQIMNDRLKEPNARGGYVLDGYPRTILQGDALADFLLQSSQVLDQVVYLSLDDETLVERISGRRICLSCKTVYHLIFNKPKTEGRCECGSTLVQRKDDHEDTVKNRLSVYKKETAPLIEYYKRLELLIEINAEGSLEFVSKKIEKLLKVCLS